MSGVLDRREFVKAGSGAMIGAVVGANLPVGASAATTPNNAELIFRGGNIITMDDKRRQVAAVAVAGGRIIAADDEAEVMKTRTGTTQIVELQGRTLMPSFIDAHGHFMNAPQIVRWANVSGVPAGPVRNISDIVAVLKAHQAKFKPKAGEWIVGYGYDGTTLKEGRELTRDDLDPHFPDNPVMLIHVSNHGAVLNSRGFAVSKIDKNTKTPPGGVILRKEGSTEPAGLLMETAFIPLFANMPQPTQEELLDNLDAAQQLYASQGMTTCQEGATHAHDLAFLRKGAEQGRLYLDIVSLPLVLEIPKFVQEYFPGYEGGKMDVPDTARTAFGSYQNRLKLQGIKVLLDGSPQGKTAFWTEPLLTPGPSGEANWRGQPLFPPEVVNKVVKELYDKKLQVFCHCNGDASIDMMIDAARAAGVEAVDDRRTVIIHSQFMRPEQLDTYVQLGFSPSFFTEHAFFWGSVHVKNLGKERAFYLSPMKSAVAKGLRCSNHNDFSVTPIEPMRMTWSAVARESREGEVIGPDERVDRWQALKAITIESAWQIREENDKGTIEVGKLADLVILDGDPLTVETAKILDIRPLQTFKEGKSVYQRAA